MKTSSISFIAVVFLLIACNNNKSADKPITVTDKEGNKTVTIDPAQIKEAALDLQQQKEKLAAMTPLTSDELKALVPERMMDAPLTDLDINSAMGATVANADYKLNDTAKLTLEIVDCAGPGGSGMFGLQYMNLINMNTEDDDEYTRTIDFNGGKAFENCKKKRNRCSLTFISGDRFMVSLRGNNIGIDELKAAAKELAIK